MDGSLKATQTIEYPLLVNPNRDDREDIQSRSIFIGHTSECGFGLVKLLAAQCTCVRDGRAVTVRESLQVGHKGLEFSKAGGVGRHFGLVEGSGLSGGEWASRRGGLEAVRRRGRNSRVDEEPSEDVGLYLYDRDGGPKFGTNRAMCPSWRTRASLSS